eukprot:scaffold220119_cov14-Tisochrysis_lutea.AAC.1
MNKYGLTHQQGCLLGRACQQGLDGRQLGSDGGGGQHDEGRHAGQHLGGLLIGGALLEGKKRQKITHDEWCAEVRVVVQASVLAHVTILTL